MTIKNSIFLFFLIPALTFSQIKKNTAVKKNTNTTAKTINFTFKNLTYDYSFYDYLKFEKLVVDNNKTILSLLVDNSNGSNELNLYVLGEESNEAFVLQDDETKKIYKQIRSNLSNMPIGNEKKELNVKVGEKISFTIVFEKINPKTHKINLLDGGIENWEKRDGKYWNVYGIKLNEKTDKENDLLFDKNNKLEMFRSDDLKYGFKNQNGKIIIPSKFDNVYMVSQDGKYCSARLDGKWGIITNKGKILIPFEYESIGTWFIDDIIFAQKNGKQGFINKKNQIVVPFDYTNLGDHFVDGENEGKQNGVWVKIFLNDFIKNNNESKANIGNVTNQLLKQGVYYTGQTLNGKPSGYGKWTSDDGEWYEGEFKNGLENGKGTLRKKDGIRYYGYFKNGLPNGIFSAKQWTLGGLVSNEWYAEYENGKLISSQKTKDDFDRFLNNSSSSANNSNEKNESNSQNNNEIPKVTKFESQGEISVMGTKTVKYFVKYSDGTTGYLYKYYQKDGGKWAVYDGLANTWEYLTKEEALVKLYDYKK